MPHPRADLLQQMPHPGEDKVVKCPTNARGDARGWNWRSHYGFLDVGALLGSI